MAATPQYGTMVFYGARSRRNYSKDIYLSDVANGLINWDNGAGAGSTSDTEWRAPEPVMLIDYAQVTGTADTTKLQVIRNGVPTGDILRYAIQLTTLNNRPSPRIMFAQGDKIQAIQLA